MRLKQKKSLRSTKIKTNRYKKKRTDFKTNTAWRTYLNF